MMFKTKLKIPRVKFVYWLTVRARTLEEAKRKARKSTVVSKINPLNYRIKEPYPDAKWKDYWFEIVK